MPSFVQPKLIHFWISAFKLIDFSWNGGKHFVQLLLHIVRLTTLHLKAVLIHFADNINIKTYLLIKYNAPPLLNYPTLCKLLKKNSTSCTSWYFNPWQCNIQKGPFFIISTFNIYIYICSHVVLGLSLAVEHFFCCGFPTFTWPHDLNISFVYSERVTAII